MPASFTLNRHPNLLIKMAAAVGIEPTPTESKSVALPLGYAALFTSYCGRGFAPRMVGFEAVDVRQG